MIYGKSIQIRFFCTLVLLFLPFHIYSANDSFTISQQVGTDTISPTVPSPVTATPITSTQIDITWGASTDDQNLTGYRLFRDAVHIATTSLLTYSDSGLTASTTYSYTVEAYDWFFNISTTSAASATTTLQTPVVVVSTSTPVQTVDTSTLVDLSLRDLNIETSQMSADISWSTSRYAQFSLRWGKVSAYDLGFVRNDIFKKEHVTSIDDLEPGTTYVYELIGYSRGGNEYQLSEGSFTTQSAQETSSPQNVSNLEAVVEGDSVRLSWSNPTHGSFSKIRIVRNYNFYPRDPANGYIAYEGTGELFVDAEAFSKYNTQYYTVFTYDDSGNISSGAVIMVRMNFSELKKDDTQTAPQQNLEESFGNSDTGTSTVVTEIVSADMRDIGFIDVRVLQNNRQIEPIENIVRVSNTPPVVLEIPYELLSENLKTILVTVQDLHSPSVSYMLRINKNKTAYQAVLPPFETFGEYLLTFSVYDYKTQLLKTFDGVLQVESESLTRQVFRSEFIAWHVVVKFLFLCFLILLFLYWNHERKRDS